MVSGLFVPTLAAYFVKGSRPEAAMAGMLGGGGITLWLIATRWEGLGGLDPSIVGIAVSLAVFSIVQIIGNRRNPND